MFFVAVVHMDRVGNARVNARGSAYHGQEHVRVGIIACEGCCLYDKWRIGLLRSSEKSMDFFHEKHVHSRYRIAAIEFIKELASCQ
ncbi:hypothetical protein D3C86_1842490 [compost metagenome]